MRRLGIVMKTTIQKEQTTGEAVLVKSATVARALSVTGRYVLQLEEQGVIPSVRFGKRCVRFHLPAVLAAVGAHQEARTGELAQ